MAKIVLIGAGSHVFSRHLITDILTYPELRDSTISLMDISQEPLDLISGFAHRLVTQNGFKTKIESTTGPPRGTGWRRLCFRDHTSRGLEGHLAG